MKLLAWDTSAKVGCVVAMEWPTEGGANTSPKLVAEWMLGVEATHSERLLWGIHELLESANWKLGDVDVFGIGVGPGSFTGLRIGVTTARTLASTLGKPLIAVSSLAALARPVALAQASKKTIVVAATDACKGELFALWGNAKSITDCTVMAEGDDPGYWKRGVEEQVISPDALMKILKRKLGSDGRWVAVGEGRLRYLDAWKALPRNQEIELLLPYSDHVQGRYLGLLCYQTLQAGLARSPSQVIPRYVRASDAELKLKAGLLRK